MHTKGPWEIHTEQDGSIYRNVSVFICRQDELWPQGQLARVNEQDGLGEREANARLIAAACTSYDRHFGDRAVEAAEADLLGQALEALEKFKAAMNMHLGSKHEDALLDAECATENVLALAKGEK
jgi:hypothetical protein